MSSRETPCFRGGHRALRPPGMSCFITDASRGLQAWAAMLSPGAPWTPALKGRGAGATAPGTAVAGASWVSWRKGGRGGGRPAPREQRGGLPGAPLCAARASWPSRTHGHLLGAPGATLRPERSRAQRGNDSQRLSGRRQPVWGCCTRRPSSAGATPRPWKRFSDAQLQNFLSVVSSHQVFGALSRSPQEANRDG